MHLSGKIHSIVRLRGALLRWLRRATGGVPSGHVVVAVGPNRRRYVVRIAHLNHPLFAQLLAQSAEEYGYGNPGPLTVHCDEKYFEEIVDYLDLMRTASHRSASVDDFQRKCLIGLRGNAGYLTDSMPLLRGGPDKSIW